MRGVESVIGAYLAVVVIVSLATGIYLAISNATSNFTSQINAGAEKLQLITNPPVLSLEPGTSSSVKLVIYPSAPLHIDSVIVKDEQGNLLYNVSVNAFVAEKYSVELPISQSPFKIIVLSSNGVAYYYMPRLDPSLSNAPDYIRNKVYVDYELIQYIQQNNSNNQSSSIRVAVLWDIGYKVYMGHAAGSYDSILVSPGPVICNYMSTSIYWPEICNIKNAAQTYNLNFLTYNMSSRLFRVSGTSITVTPPAASSASVQWYIQVYRVLRVSGATSANFTVSVSISGGPVDFVLMPVVYVYEVNYNLADPVTIYQSGISAAWLRRITLEGGYITVRANAQYSKTYSVAVNIAELGLSEAYIIVGVEAVIPTYAGVYLTAQISITNS